MNAKPVGYWWIAAFMSIALAFAGELYAKPGGNGGGGGKPGGGGGGEPTGCSTVGPSNYFPTIVYRESTRRRGKDYWSIGFGSADGSCRQTVKEFPAGQYGGLYPAFWVSPDGSHGLLAWRDSGDNITGNTVSIQIADFTIDRSGSAPVVSLGADSAVVTFEPGDYRFWGTLGHDFSADGQCLAFVADTPTHDEMRAVDVGGDCGWTGTIALDPGIPDRPDELAYPRWSPDGSSIFARIVEYQFAGDNSGAFGIVRADLGNGTFEVTVQPSRTQQVLEFDVGSYHEETHVIFGQEDGTLDDGNPDACPFIRLVKGDGTPVETSGQPVKFRGRYPLWTRFGTLADVDPSVIYFAGSGDQFCSGLGAMETDPVALGPISIDYPENDFRWYDAN